RKWRGPGCADCEICPKSVKSAVHALDATARHLIQGAAVIFPMHCLGLVSFVVLGCSRRENCFVLGGVSSCQQRSLGYISNCNVLVVQSSGSSSSFGSDLYCSCRSPAQQSSLLGVTPITESLRVRGREPLNSAGRGSGSTPEFDTAGATATAAAAAADTDSITKIADVTTTQDLTLVSLMELAFDTLGGNTQWIVAGAVGVALVTRADVGTLVYVVGSLFNAVFSKILKKTINQVRPEGARLSDPGMPSSHAMSLFYLGTYLVIGLQEHGVLTLDPSLPQWPLGVTGTQTLLGMYAFSASLWRVKAGFHTLPQVSVGAAVGAVDAVLWYHFCQAYLSSQARAFFGGPDIPVGLAVGVCLVTFLTFGNAQRKISKILGRKKEP
ncbi:unnamed protein product, partial [Pylaiella littoralis]